MGTKPAESASRKPSLPPRERREREAAEQARIRKSMLKWEGMDEVARRLGRGLGRRELVDRVAKEVGASLRQVLSALKR